MNSIETAAMTLAAARLGMLNPANAQPANLRPAVAGFRRYPALVPGCRPA
jgi:hypothetical protein